VIKRISAWALKTIQRCARTRWREINQEIVFDLQGKETILPLSDYFSVCGPDLHEALRLRATDIHLEPYPNSIGCAIAWMAMLEMIPVRRTAPPCTPPWCRGYLMAGLLTLAEKRLPHDGRIAMKTGEGRI